MIPIGMIMAFLKGNWRTLLPIGIIAGLGLALLFARMDAAHWRKKFNNQVALEKLAEAERQRDKAVAEAGFAKHLADATADYASRLADRQPLILRSKDTVREYAQTPEGRSICLAPERVRAIDDYDRALGDTAAAEGSTGAVHHPAAFPAE